MSKQPSSDSGAGRKRPVMKIAAGAVVLIVVVAGVWFSGLLSHLGGHGAGRTAAIAEERPVLVDLPDMVSNLDTGNRRSSFIKLHAKLQVAHAADAVSLQSDIPQILDVFQTYLRSTRPDELRGGEGTYRLREALMNRVDAVVAPVQVTDLLFTEILVQ